MSTTEDIMTACAVCRKGDCTLHKCTACKSVKYCNVACQKAHRKSHKKECRKRAAQLFDEALFNQPPQRDECPICFLLLPHDIGEVIYQPCCGQNLCSGCMHQMAVDDSDNCPFCWEPAPNSDEEWVARCNKRMEAGDANAFQFLGTQYYKGIGGYPKDLKKAFELYSCAAELGSADGHYNVGNIDEDGKLMERDLIKAVNLGSKQPCWGMVWRGTISVVMRQRKGT